MATANRLPNLAASLPQRNRALAYVRALTFTVWFLLLVVGFWWRQEWDDVFELVESGVNLKQLYYVGIAVAIAGHLTLGWRPWLNLPFEIFKTWPIRLMTCFCALQLLLVPISVTPRTTAVYATGTWVVLAMGYLYWQSDYFIVKRVLVFSGVLLLLWLFVLLVHHGLARGFGSTIGGINRNTIGKVALAIIILTSFSSSRVVRWCSLAAGVALMLLITSRGSILATAVFLAVYYVLQNGTARAMGHAAIAVVVCAFILLFSQVLQDAVLEDVMRLNDPIRGIGSGLTGRVDTWKSGLEDFAKRPVFGYGYRASVAGSKGGAHGGYIRLLIETGIVGSFLAVSSTVLEVLRRRRLTNQFREISATGSQDIDIDESIRLNAVSAGILCAMLTLWLYEPIYLNLGTVISVLFFMSFSAPSAVPNRFPTAVYVMPR